MNVIRHFLVIPATILAILVLCSASRADREEIFKFRYKGQDREYRLVVPDSLAEGRPLVIMLHGYTAKASPERFGLKAAAHKYGFVLCNPQGEKDLRGKTCWNVGYPFQEGLRTDDVGFLCALAKHLVKEYGLDGRNVFCAGHSNGGEMCYLLAYLKPDVFSAVAPLAGLTLEWMLRELKPKGQIPLFEIHGTADRTSLWTGDPENAGGWGSYLSVPLAVSYWAAVNRCTHEITEEIPNRSGKPVIAHKFVGGDDGREVWLYEIEGAGHSWSEDDLDTGAALWSFFSQYIK